jgi:hypothetical protein
MTSLLEAQCDHCRQLRPLFLYEPTHGLHLGSAAFSCEWCRRAKQPLLCARCWSTEREREEGDPGLNTEAEVWERICRTNSQHIQRGETARRGKRHTSRELEGRRRGGAETRSGVPAR